MPEKYSEVNEFLRGKNIVSTPEAEEYAQRYALNLVRASEEIPKEEREVILSVFLLRGAEICVTRNMSQEVTEEGFAQEVPLTANDLRTSAITSLSSCLEDPYKERKELNRLCFVVSYSGEEEKLRTLDIDSAKELAEWSKKDFLEEISEKYGLLTPQIWNWFRIKVDIWFEIANLISGLF